MVSETHTHGSTHGRGNLRPNRAGVHGHSPQITGIDTCGAFTDAYLAAIAGVLDLSQASILSLQVGDFSGLTRLTALNLSRNELIAL